MKKAISPIIATILLIVVSLALIAIILSWGSNFITKNTTEADNAIDKDCTNIYLSFISCDYDNLENEFQVSIVNSGKVNFKPDYNFNVVLKDADNIIDLTNIDVLDSRGLLIGESDFFVIEDYEGKSPITLTIRNTMCPINYWETRCS